MRRKGLFPWVPILAIAYACLVMAVKPIAAQTMATGAITGTVQDPSGAAIVGAKVTATLASTGETRQTATNAQGIYRFSLLPPGQYRLSSEKAGFKEAIREAVPVEVTETATVDFRLELGSIAQKVEVMAQPNMAQTQSSALGRVVTERSMVNLPLATRNYTQILALSPGVTAPVNNATDLGRGNGGLSGIVSNSFTQDESVHANGARGVDNNFQMNGLGVNDLGGEAGGSGGVPIPNPDTIQEFKVQTGQYDVSYGRNAGANVDVITKTGTNNFHGNAWEFFRNTDLNANDYFSNLTGQPRGALNQNQFGGAVGGPIKKKKVHFFTSYQGTRQKNGLANQCYSTEVLPPLTNDRSAHAIATIFNGQRGMFQNLFGGVGPAIDENAPSGNGTPYPYNINPAALAILQLKLPNGNYMVPNPQTPSGLTRLNDPCTFNDDQGMANGDYVVSDRSRIALRYFIDNSNQTITFPFNGVGSVSGTDTPGSPVHQPERFQVFSISHTYTISPTLLNTFRLGFRRTTVFEKQHSAYSFSQIGAAVSPYYNSLPGIGILGCCELGGGEDESTIQQAWDLTDVVSWSHGRQNLQIGGGVIRGYLDNRNFLFNGVELYPTFPDFLLGLNGAEDGTGVFSNILVAIDFLGNADRDERSWDSYGYLQDNVNLTRRLTLNAGLRYERIGAFSDTRGRNGNFNPLIANPDPPASGSLTGYVVPSNFPGTVPAGVTRASNRMGIAGNGQNTVSPRLGFAWQVLPHSDRLVLRSGYGIYYSTPIGNEEFQTLTSPPFGLFRLCVATCNAAASAENPFSPAPPLSAFPIFQPYSPSTSLSVLELAQNFQPPIVQEYSLGVQSQLSPNLLLEVGYVGSRSTRLIRSRGLNQALSASPTNPVRGQTSNTFANIGQRVPYIGFTPGASGVNAIESAGGAWYNALEASVTKRLSHGLTFLASYTWSRELDTQGISPNWESAGGTATYGNQSDVPSVGYGPGLFNRDQRLVVSYVYDLPSPKQQFGWKARVLGGWQISGVTTVQSGQHLTLTGPNTFNAFGITDDRIEMAPGCTYSQLLTHGSIESRLSNYFNTACISPTWPVIGADGIATGFGNSGTGIVLGPGQNNWDIAIRKKIPMHENQSLLFRAQFFNAFNHPQFLNPNTDMTDSTFGFITGTSVNPRVVQLALEYSF